MPSVVMRNPMGDGKPDLDSILNARKNIQSVAVSSLQSL